MGLVDSRLDKSGRESIGLSVLSSLLLVTRLVASRLVASRLAASRLVASRLVASLYLASSLGFNKVAGLLNFCYWLFFISILYDSIHTGKKFQIVDQA